MCDRRSSPPSSNRDEIGSHDMMRRQQARHDSMNVIEANDTSSRSPIQPRCSNTSTTTLSNSHLGVLMPWTSFTTCFNAHTSWCALSGRDPRRLAPRFENSLTAFEPSSLQLRSNAKNTSVSVQSTGRASTDVLPRQNDAFIGRVGLSSSCAHSRARVSEMLRRPLCCSVKFLIDDSNDCQIFERLLSPIGTRIVLGDDDDDDGEVGVSISQHLDDSSSTTTEYPARRGRKITRASTSDRLAAGWLSPRVILHSQSIVMPPILMAPRRSLIEEANAGRSVLSWSWRSPVDDWSC